MRQTLADQLIEVLLDAGVQRIYGVVGDSLNPVVDAVRRAGGMGWGAVGHGGAGAVGAPRTGAAGLAIASHIPSVQVGTGYFQETHPERVFVDCSHFCELVSQPAQMPRVWRTAAQHALGLGGVSVLAVSGDVLHRAAPNPTGKTGV